LGLAMSLPLVFAGGLGGGDAKLLAAVGHSAGGHVRDAP
jgi:Flp pilus assembly protein protease CpaA